MQGTPPFVSSVHAPERESHQPEDAQGAVALDRASPAERFRHSGWQRTRDLLRASLLRTGQANSRVLNWDNCGFGAYILQSIDRPGVLKVAGSSCHDRFCTPCARLRSQCIANALVETIGTRVVRFVTLTLRHRSEPVQQTLDRLYECFGKLRRSKLWKSKVKGGAAFLELKWAESSGEWHPHLHVLVVGSYLPQPRLRAQWFAITGDSHVVDVRLARGTQEVSRYVSKYVTKLVSSSFVNRPDLLDEAVVAMHGRKMCLTFGTWRGVRLTADDSSDAWVNLGSLNNWLSKALRGEPDALALLATLDPDFLAAEITLAEARPPPPQMTVQVPNDAQPRFSYK